jgi:hypothetical protein
MMVVMLHLCELTETRHEAKATTWVEGMIFLLHLNYSYTCTLEEQGSTLTEQ